MKKKVQVSISDGRFSEKLYEKIPCTIGFVYLRLEVDGSVRPCCISRVTTGNLNQEPLDSIWHGSRQAAFRQKLFRINQDKFHLEDPDWAFCQQCSHKKVNIENAQFINEAESEDDHED